jgi:hypothetical protein
MTLEELQKLRNDVKEMAMLIYDLAEVNSEGNITNAEDIAFSILEWQTKYLIPSDNFEKKPQKPKDIDKVVLGDKVVFSKSISKYVIVGKPYEIISLSSEWADYWRAGFAFIAEEGKEKRLHKHAKGYRMQFYD